MCNFDWQSNKIRRQNISSDTEHFLANDFVQCRNNSSNSASQSECVQFENGKNEETAIEKELQKPKLIMYLWTQGELSILKCRKTSTYGFWQAGGRGATSSRDSLAIPVPSISAKYKACPILEPRIYGWLRFEIEEN